MTKPTHETRPGVKVALHDLGYSPDEVRVEVDCNHGEQGHTESWFLNRHLALDVLFQPIEEPETDDKQWAVEVLGMVKETLQQLGCKHGTHDEQTPPMMYPEWIACTVKEAREAGIREGIEKVVAWYRERGQLQSAVEIEFHFTSKPQQSDAERLREIAAGLPSGDGWDSTAAIILEIADRMEAE